MSDKPEDVASRCNARLYLADDYGDNTCTFCCQLDEGHGGKHNAAFNMGMNAETSNLVEVTWEQDMRCYHEFVECEHEWKVDGEGWWRCEKCYWLTCVRTVSIPRMCKFCGCEEGNEDG